MLVTCRIVPAALLLAVHAWAQSPSFEVASIKLAERPGNCRGGPATTSPGQWTCFSTLKSLITQGWGNFGDQLAGPAAMDTQYYEIVAKVPPDATKKDFNLMVQRLLVERLGVTVHHEMREQQVFELVVGKGGSKLHDAEPAASLDAATPAQAGVRLVRDKYGNMQLPPGRPGVMEGGVDNTLRLTARMQTMEQIARTLSRILGHVVIDQTGLTGHYDYILSYLPITDNRQPNPLTPAGQFTEVNAPAPSIFQAVDQQLGLKLVSKRAPVDVLVVDTYHKVPSENQ